MILREFYIIYWGHRAMTEKKGQKTGKSKTLVTGMSHQIFHIPTCRRFSWNWVAVIRVVWSRAVFEFCHCLSIESVFFTLEHNLTCFFWFLRVFTYCVCIIWHWKKEWTNYPIRKASSWKPAWHQKAQKPCILSFIVAPHNLQAI